MAHGSVWVTASGVWASWRLAESSPARSVAIARAHAHVSSPSQGRSRPCDRRRRAGPDLNPDHTPHRRFLDALACRNVAVTMGNHDARDVGYRHFEDFFGSRDSVTTVEVAGPREGRGDHSTKPDVDEGEVGREHYGWLDAELRGWTEGPRIVVIHHHTLAVPGTGRDVNNLCDAGDVMAILRGSRSTWCCPDTAMCRTCGAAPGRAWCTRHRSTLRVRGTVPSSHNVIESDADEVRIGMRQPGQGISARSAWLASRRPAATSESIRSSSASCAMCHDHELGIDSASVGSVGVPRRSAQVATWPRSRALEAWGGAPRSFHRSFAAGEDLLHSLVDPHARIMRDMTNRACALGASWFQSHHWLLSRVSPGRFETRIQLA